MSDLKTFSEWSRLDGIELPDFGQLASEAITKEEYQQRVKELPGQNRTGDEGVIE